MIVDMPTITEAAHTHSVYSPANLAMPIGFVAGTTAGAAASWMNSPLNQPLNQNMFAPGDALQRTSSMRHLGQAAAAMDTAAMPKPKKEKPVSRRLVQVFIADPDENVPLDKALLYSGSQKFTDATDQELFFEIDMKSILDNYNAERVKIVNKKVKERTEMLEPVKIRDLKMTVVSVATF
jgi:hypothetical protein